MLLADGEAFVPAWGSPVPTGRGTYNLAAGDLDQDERVDLVATAFEGDAITVLLAR